MSDPITRIPAGVSGKTKAPKAKRPSWTDAHKATFEETAPAGLTVTINGVPFVAEYKRFSTGSVGYYLNGKMPLVVDGKPVMVDGQPVYLQLGCNLSALGSKPGE